MDIAYADTSANTSTTHQLICQVFSFLNTHNWNEQNMILPSCIDLLIRRNKEIGEWKRGSHVEIEKEDQRTCNNLVQHMYVQDQGSGPQAHERFLPDIHWPFASSRPHNTKGLVSGQFVTAKKHSDGVRLAVYNK